MAYAKLFPFGDERAEISMAHQTYHLVTAWTENDERQPKDFMPKFNDGPLKTEAELIVAEILESM
jgi:hypothetical protein